MIELIGMHDVYRLTVCRTSDADRARLNTNDVVSMRTASVSMEGGSYNMIVSSLGEPVLQPSLLNVQYI